MTERAAGLEGRDDNGRESGAMNAFGGAGACGTDCLLDASTGAARARRSANDGLGGAALERGLGKAEDDDDSEIESRCGLSTGEKLILRAVGVEMSDCLECANEQ